MNTQLIDNQRLNEFTENDTDLVADLAVLFARAVPEYLASMDLAVAESNPVAIHEISHQIKSQLAYFFCKKLVDQAAQLEEMGEQGSIDDAATVSQSLARGIEELLKELSQLTGLNLEITDE